ncbi:MAG: ssl1498 family light-harvesting-like protein [Symploca sp. SIO2G7]|nr:ssl1498 family light-harvesting-like protein [Symploca sp. SIO2G7]
MTNDTNTLERNYSDGSELIPAEVGARSFREGSLPPNTPAPQENAQQLDTLTPNTTGGYTVDQEGLINNYATTPEMYEANYPSPHKQHKYFIQGAIATVFVGLLVSIAFVIS